MDERYNTKAMKTILRGAVKASDNPNSNYLKLCFVKLGHQGNPVVLVQVQHLLSQHGKKSFLMLLRYISPPKLSLLPHIDVWVQVSYTRLSVDWRHHLYKQLFNSFELHVSMGDYLMVEKC